MDLALVLAQFELYSAFFELCKGQGDRSQILMLTTWYRPEKFKLNLTLDLVFAEVCGADLHLVPFEGASLWSLDLRFVDRGKLARRDLTIDHEEAEAGLLECGDWVKDHYFSVSLRCHLLGRDSDFS